MAGGGARPASSTGPSSRSRPTTERRSASTDSEGHAKNLHGEVTNVPVDSASRCRSRLEARASVVSDTIGVERGRLADPARPRRTAAPARTADGRLAGARSSWPSGGARRPTSDETSCSVRSSPSSDRHWGQYPKRTVDFPHRGGDDPRGQAPASFHSDEPIEGRGSTTSPRRSRGSRAISRRPIDRRTPGGQLRKDLVTIYLENGGPVALSRRLRIRRPSTRCSSTSSARSATASALER